MCHKVPGVEVHKVPRTVCQPVPDIRCANVLSPVTEVACEPVVTQDCRKIAVEVRSDPINAVYENNDIVGSIH